MFLQTNDRIINLQNVSNINILKDRNRIVFNMNYNIEISTNYGDKKYISDYVYWDARDIREVEKYLEKLNVIDYFNENFINQIDGNGYINKNEISSVKFSDRKNRVIFNLSHPVTFKDFDGNDKITSEFVYVNCNNSTQYEKYLNYVKS